MEKGQSPFFLASQRRVINFVEIASLSSIGFYRQIKENAGFID